MFIGGGGPVIENDGGLDPWGWSGRVPPSGALLWLPVVE